MAEINSAGNQRQKGGIRRCKKLSTKIDLTPMVDLGFLLITFFVFTSALGKPKEIVLYLPAGESPSTPAGESTVLTVIPISNNKNFYYHGNFEHAMIAGLYGITSFSITGGIGDIIRKKQIALSNNPTFKKSDLLLIIKPTAEASYQNIIDAMDEVLINDIKHYAFVELDTIEKETIKNKSF